jgi:hypothetical protein
MALKLKDIFFTPYRSEIYIFQFPRSSYQIKMCGFCVAGIGSYLTLRYDPAWGMVRAAVYDPVYDPTFSALRLQDFHNGGRARDLLLR